MSDAKHGAEEQSPTKYNLPFLWLICVIAAMGGLLFGYDWVVIGGAKPFYEPALGIAGDSMDSAFWRGFAMSAALVGCVFGAMVSGVFSDSLGRKRLLIFAGLLFTASAVWTALSVNFVSFNLARFLGGLGIGLASNLSPMYIAEISPAKMRGRFVSINQLTIVIGILAAQITNLLIAQEVPEGATTEFIRESWNGTHGWRWMFGAETIPAAAFFLLMFFVPESPRWLVKNGQLDRARQILARVGGAAYAERETQEIAATISEEEVAQVRFSDLAEPKLMKIVGLGVFLAVFQQWCGINVIFNYAQEVFQSAGYQVGDLMFGIVITGIVNLVFTFIAIFTVDRLGRRPLMLIGSAGLTGIYAVLGAAYFFEFKGLLMLILVVSAIACYAMSLAPVTWVVISEIFPNRIRGAAMSVAVVSLWLGCTALTFTFPLLNQTLGAHGTFWLYGLICAIGFIVIWQRLPETKSRSLEEIERQLVD